MSGLIWVQTFAKVISRWQKSPLVDIELNTELFDFLAIKTLYEVKSHLAPTFFIWLKCWLQQILNHLANLNEIFDGKKSKSPII